MRVSPAVVSQQTLLLNSPSVPEGDTGVAAGPSVLCMFVRNGKIERREAR